MRTGEPGSLIQRLLLEPNRIATLTTLEWDLLIRQGRRANLLAKLAILIEARGQLPLVPQAPAQHLLSAIRIARRQRLAVLWEVECIGRALGEVPLPVILLKGAAYVIADCVAAQGRLFSDVDILVQKSMIAQAENALIIHGWRSEDLDAYDQQYYRRWMHEIPPMRHTSRDTSVDVHHTILPETARVKVNVAALFNGACAIPGRPETQVLQPVDMFLHSAAHLFHEGELDHGLRDLFDLDSLLREFGVAPSFWPSLIPRARMLGLGRPMFYALRYVSMMLGTPVPAEAIIEARRDGPSNLVLALMDACYLRALQPVHESCVRFGTRAARQALYIRSHWLRMPVHLLCWHLLRKMLKGAAADASAAEALNNPEAAKFDQA